MKLFSFLSKFSNENNCILPNNFEEKGLKHYGCELFSAIVLTAEERLMNMDGVPVVASRSGGEV